MSDVNTSNLLLFSMNTRKYRSVIYLFVHHKEYYRNNFIFIVCCTVNVAGAFDVCVCVWTSCRSSQHVGSVMYLNGEQQKHLSPPPRILK